MFKGNSFDQDYRPQFSGHETFPLRYGWLKKAFDAVNESSEEQNRSIFTRPESIADFGVGRNMVLSIRYWATVAGVITEPDSDGRISTTDFGKALFDQKGFDPYLEHPSSLWLLHWKLAGNPKRTTWYWAFNLFPNLTFDRVSMAQHLLSISKDLSWTRSSAATIKRDVECFVRTYVPKRITTKLGFEDSVECPLTELGLIKSVGGKESFRFARGPKQSLGDGVFLYALEDYWSSINSNTLSLEALAFEPGSPGRVFQLDEVDLIHRFSRIERISASNYRWSETAGLKQVIKVNTTADVNRKLEYLNLDYQPRGKVKLA